MSYTIEYQWRAMRIDFNDFSPGLAPRYAVLIEDGCNNVTELRNGFERRARDWGIRMLGTENQVLRQALIAAAYCEVGEIKQLGRAVAPEAYLRRVRRLLAHAEPANSGLGHLVLSARVNASHPLVTADLPQGCVREPDRWYGEETFLVRPVGLPEWGDFFRLVDPYLTDGSLSPIRCGDVYGLPRS